MAHSVTNLEFPDHDYATAANEGGYDGVIETAFGVVKQGTMSFGPVFSLLDPAAPDGDIPGIHDRDCLAFIPHQQSTYSIDLQATLPGEEAAIADYENEVNLLGDADEEGDADQSEMTKVTRILSLRPLVLRQSSEEAVPAIAKNRPKSEVYHSRAGGSIDNMLGMRRADTSDHVFAFDGSGPAF